VGRVSGTFRSLYREEAAAWRERYRRYFKYAARALGLGFVAGFLFFMLWPAQEKRALAFVVQALKDIPLNAGPALMALTLFYHNARASVVAIAAGAIPFLFLPILDPLINGAVLGLLVSIARHQRMDVPRLVLTQILPHGIFELTAVLYATSLGLYLSAAMGKKVKEAWRARDRKKAGERRKASATAAGIAPPQEPAVWPDVAVATPPDEASASAADTRAAAMERKGPCEAGLFRDVVRSFVLVVLPLLLVAAIVEAFVTPHLR
jgi:stage II sporulation protein M